MKKLFAIIALFAGISAMAQAPSAEQKRAAIRKVDSLVSRYLRYSTFLVSGKSTITPEAITAFNGLFESNAIIPDEAHPEFFYRDMRPEQLRTYFDYYHKIAGLDKMHTGPVQEFTQKVQQLHDEGFSVRLLNSDVQYGDLKNHSVKVLLSKSLQGFFKNDLVLESRDTVIVSIRLSEDWNDGAISGITVVGHQLNYINDRDHDFVSDKNDKCPDVKGYFSATGCPTDRELSLIAGWAAHIKDSIHRRDSIIEAVTRCKRDSSTRAQYMARITRLTSENPHWWLSAGVLAGQGKFSGTERNFAGNYESAATDSFTTPGVVFKGGSLVGGFAQAEYYFGTKATFGIGAGIQYTTLSGSLTSNAFRIQYKATDTHIAGHSFDYRQIITSEGGLEEKFKMTNMALPLSLIYRGSISGKIGFRIEAGGLLSLSAKTSMESRSGNFNYEAVYRFSSDNQSVYSSTTGANDWIITEEFLNAHSTSHDARAYINALGDRGYPVGFDRQPSSSNSETALKTGVGYFVRPSLSWLVNEDFTVNLGFYYSGITMKGNAGGYQLINTTGKYNSLLNSFDQLKVTNYGVSLSITHSLFYPRARWKRELANFKTTGNHSCGQLPK